MGKFRQFMEAFKVTTPEEMAAYQKQWEKEQADIKGEYEKLSPGHFEEDPYGTPQWARKGIEQMKQSQIRRFAAIHARHFESSERVCPDTFAAACERYR